MKEMRVDIGGGNFLETGPGSARVEYADGGRYNLLLEEIGQISDWLAEAWANVAGEEYSPVAISERGYVALEGVVHAGEWVIPKADIVPIEDAVEIATRIPRTVRLERDCE